MYGPNDLDVLRLRHDELAHEAENGRLVRRLRAERPKKVTPLGGGRFRSIRVGMPRRKGAA